MSSAVSRPIAAISEQALSHFPTFRLFDFSTFRLFDFSTFRLYLNMKQTVGMFTMPLVIIDKILF